MSLLLGHNSSQAGTFVYHCPGGDKVGPTTYLRLSSMDSNVIDWEKMPLPQDVISLDLRQPEIFKTVQVGDAQCDSENDSGTCAADDEECKMKNEQSRPPTAG